MTFDIDQHNSEDLRHLTLWWPNIKTDKDKKDKDKKDKDKKDKWTNHKKTILIIKPLEPSEIDYI